MHQDSTPLYSYVSYSDTGYFSPLVTDYLDGNARLKPYYAYTPDMAGINSAIEDRKNYPVDRETLVKVLQKQYEGVEISAKVASNLQLLALDNTYTVCTAHQPCLLTGYLYFIYKILHAVKLAESLEVQHPDKHFVPVFYMGSEDNDFEELSCFRFRGDKYRWQKGDKAGAVGRMLLQGITEDVLKPLFKYFGPPGKNMETLKEHILQCYKPEHTVAQATRLFVNRLLGKYGVIVLDADSSDLKQSYIPVMQEELLKQTSLPLLSETLSFLNQHYKVQAHPRAINLFYLIDNVRERIIEEGYVWKVLNTSITFTEAELLAELQLHPERFSPNVILRGMYQETILPNVVFIGGGAEVSYWLQLKKIFSHHKVFFPVVMLRQSVLWKSEKATELQMKCNLSDNSLFLPLYELENQFINTNYNDLINISNEKTAIQAILDIMTVKATHVDATLNLAGKAITTKINKYIDTLQYKMRQAEKRKHQAQLNRIIQLKSELFPQGNLQERHDSFLEYYLIYGEAYFDILLNGMLPYNSQWMNIGWV